MPPPVPGEAPACRSAVIPAHRIFPVAILPATSCNRASVAAQPPPANRNRTPAPPRSTPAVHRPRAAYRLLRAADRPVAPRLLPPSTPLPLPKISSPAVSARTVPMMCQRACATNSVHPPRIRSSAAGTRSANRIRAEAGVPPLPLRQHRHLQDIRPHRNRGLRPPRHRLLPSRSPLLLRPRLPLNRNPLPPRPRLHHSRGLRPLPALRVHAQTLIRDRAATTMSRANTTARTAYVRMNANDAALPPTQSMAPVRQSPSSPSSGSPHGCWGPPRDPK